MTGADRHRPSLATIWAPRPVSNVRGIVRRTLAERPHRRPSCSAILPRQKFEKFAGKLTKIFAMTEPESHALSASSTIGPARNSPETKSAQRWTQRGKKPSHRNRWLSCPPCTNCSRKNVIARRSRSLPMQFTNGISNTLTLRRQKLEQNFLATKVGQQLEATQVNQQQKRSWKGWAAEVSGNLAVNFVTLRCCSASGGWTRCWQNLGATPACCRNKKGSRGSLSITSVSLTRSALAWRRLLPPLPYRPNGSGDRRRTVPLSRLRRWR